MTIISSKAVLSPIIKDLINIYHSRREKKFIHQLQGEILKSKIRFPLLEHVGIELYKNIPLKEQISVLDKIISLGEMGGYTIAGKMLQLRLEKHFNESIKKAVEYIIEGDEWYVCDIIGERVFGHALVTWPEKTIPIMKKHAKHSDKWIVRSVGVATHYAVKRGLDKNNSETIFKLLLTLAGETEFHTKKGIGWGAKTISKFYPSIIELYEEEIMHKDVRAWFRTKIKIGLGRANKYAR